MIYKTEVRGSFSGTGRVLKQALRDGFAVNYTPPSDFLPLVLTSYADYNK